MKTLLLCLFISGNVWATRNSDDFSTPEVYVLQSDSATTLALPINSPIQLIVAPNTTTYVDCTIIYQTAATTTGIGLGVRIPASPGAFGYTSRIPFAADGIGSEWVGFGTASLDMIISTGVQAANTSYVADLRGLHVNGPNAGRFTIVFQSEVAASNVVVKAGSSCRFYSERIP